jgi:hypothetical protein
MTLDFSQLKANRSQFKDQIKQELEKGSNSWEDEREWKPTVDANNNGSAIIRFLPPSPGEDLPSVRMFSHWFRGPGGIYAENSLTSIGKDDPVSEYNTRLWNSGVESDKDIVRQQKRKLAYWANIYVVSDPGNRDNEGKIFLYKFGKKIHDKIQEKLFPEFDDEQEINVFDFWDGANFRLKIKDVDGWRNYDKSAFDEPSALFDNDEDLERVWKQQHSLQALLDESNFKTYEELQSKLNRVLGLNNQSVNVAETTAEDHMEDTWSPPEEDDMPSVSSLSSSSEEDDSLDFFKKLAEA